MQRCDPNTRARLRERTKGRCDLCGQQGRLDPHRRKQGSLGGRYVLGNLLGLCRRCHNLVHDRVALALDKGWLVEGWEDPERTVVWTIDGWVRLTDDGQVIRSLNPSPAGSDA